jgi:hypothetical protein
MALDQNAKRAWFQDHPGERVRILHYVATERVLGILDEINTISFWHGIAIPNEWRTGPGELWTGNLPSLDCQAHLIAAKRRNPQWEWHQHDRTDIASLSAALPYVDILVTEKQWCHVIRQAGLDIKYRTQVVSSISDLLEAADAL